MVSYLIEKGGAEQFDVGLVPALGGLLPGTGHVLDVNERDEGIKGCEHTRGSG